MVRLRVLACLVGAALLGSGCATRGIGSGPTTEPGASTWFVVGVASLLAAVVLGVLLVRPDRRAQGGGAPVAAAVLSLHAGALVVGTSVLVGLAVRSGQLAGRPLDAEMAVSLVRVSRLDGDGDLFALLVLTLVVLGGLATWLVVLAGRFSLGRDPVERWITVAVLVLELAVVGVAGLQILDGERGIGWTVVALQVPLVGAALADTWPRRTSTSPPASPQLSPPA